MVGLYLPYKKSENDSSEDNDYKNNNLGISPIPQKEESNSDKNNNDKLLSKLLDVDDESDIVQVLKLGLLQNRFLVSAFTNPEEALQSFKSNAESYCLVLSDVRMTGLSEIQLAKKVRD